MVKNLKYRRFQIFVLILSISILFTNVYAQSKIKSRCAEFERQNAEFERQNYEKLTNYEKRRVNNFGGSVHSGGDYGSNNQNIPIIEEKPIVYPAGTKPLQIKSKPRAPFTDEARKNCIQGTVILRLTFLSNGKVGKIKVVKGLPAGLSKQAIDVAKKVKFEPAQKNFKPISVTKKLSYNFTIY